MTEPLPAVGLFDVRRLRLVETEAPQLSPEDARARDRVWSRAVRANPHLFDGPVVACAGMAREGDGLVLSWARVTYRHYALRRVPGNTSWLPPLFVSVVQPTCGGHVLVGRMSPSTAAPGRWQLPGGSAEPPADGGALDEGALRSHAARELEEEAGTRLDPEDLRLWAVSRGENRSVGLFYLAPPRSAAELRESFEAATEAERASGRAPELDRIAFVASPADLSDLEGPHVAYLEHVVRRCWGCGGLPSGVRSAR
ncbi:NUDIX domain-containing protein [Nocardiopsis algeriensis]|uniref:8-oxo-dGTP pyrophosphatase MutT (NUDIX family) n=1 Tax=Nocardiopsis algeriensis TaxID=1478215 RepID=A0A841IPV4_9ACTN|nr:NUDIX domain-containing protein [Nocardiopsis algeriensis]MBB6118361.1 8-oxo-dGTP pyrophosphatase MutT (NUDIX family) [Nocardiopsis algeriensis]